MANRKTMEQIYQGKIVAMRKILGELKERPMKFGEIHGLVKTTRQTIHNYLKEMIALGLVEYDETQEHYSYVGIARRSFSKHDYELSWKHSKRLILENKELMNSNLFDGEMSPDVILDSLVCLELGPEFMETSYLVQHLKSGYYASFWKKFQRYSELMKEYEYPTVPNVDFKGIQHNVRGVVDHSGRMSEDEKRELEKLRIDLLVSLYKLTIHIVHGSPLDGWCDGCPGRRISIKDLE